MVWPFTSTPAPPPPPSLLSISTSFFENLNMNYLDLGKELSIGTILGLTTGYFLKELGKTLAYATGLSFVVIQIARANDWVHPNWDQIQTSLNVNLDLDGDGVITWNDLHLASNYVVGFLGYGLPSVSAFTIAFYTGLQL